MQVARSFSPNQVGSDAVVDQESRHLEQADRHAQHDQRQQPGRQAQG
jgi:hypothetical protein